MGSNVSENEQNDLQKTNNWSNKHDTNEIPTLKFSKSQISTMTTDFEDQTLQGQRMFTEEPLVDGFVRKYTYSITFTKYIKHNRPLGRPRKDLKGMKTVSNMYHENKTNSIIYEPSKEKNTEENSSSNNDDVKKNEIVIQDANKPTRKRGRPKKYIPGQEPYKIRKVKKSDADDQKALEVGAVNTCDAELNKSEEELANPISSEVV